MNHREAWAEEKKAPTADTWARVQRGEQEDETFKKASASEPKEKEQTEFTPTKTSTTDSAPKVILRKRTQT